MTNQLNSPIQFKPRGHVGYILGFNLAVHDYCTLQLRTQARWALVGQVEWPTISAARRSIQFRGLLIVRQPEQAT